MRIGVVGLRVGRLMGVFGGEGGVKEGRSEGRKGVRMETKVVVVLRGRERLST